MKKPMVLCVISAVSLSSMMFVLPARADLVIDPSWYKKNQNDRRNSLPFKLPEQAAVQANKSEVKETQTNSSSAATTADKSKNAKKKYAVKTATSRKTAKKPVAEKLSTKKSVELKSAVDKNVAKTSEASD